MKVIYDNSVEKSIDELEKPTISKVVRMIILLGQYGVELRMPHAKKITHGLYELRIRGRQEVRIFYIFRKNYVALLHLFIKKSQKTPPKEISTALKKLELLGP